MTNVIDLKMAAAGDTQNPDSPSLTFLDFWRIYPRKVARMDAEKAWAKIQLGDHPKILAALERHKQSDQWTRDNGRFIVYPATYLNGRRWEDELDGAPLMGQCSWNANGNREEGRPRCASPASTEKRGLPYCSSHAERA